MNFVTLKDLLPLVPEIIILFTSFIVILVDLFAPKKNRMTTLAVTSLVGIGLALISCGSHFSSLSFSIDLIAV